MKDWWLDEQAYAGAEHLDESYVAAYDAKAQFDPADDIAKLRSFGLDQVRTVVDLGAGTGTFAFAAASVGATVIAVDVSPAMVGRMRRRADELGLTNMAVVEAGFLSYEHEGEPADFVYTRNALHQLPDFWKVVALQRIAAMMRPGGILRLRDLVYDLEPALVEVGIQRWMGGAVDDPSQGFTAHELAHHVRSEFSTFSWLLELMLERTGFEILDRDSRRSAYGTYTCRRR